MDLSIFIDPRKLFSSCDVSSQGVDEIFLDGNSLIPMLHHHHLWLLKKINIGLLNEFIYL
jgi:hypothetical protein